MHIRHALSSVLFAAFAAVPGAAQDLRQGLLAADLVVVGRQVGKQAHDAEVVLHRLQVVHTVRGDEQAAVIVIDWPNLSLHQRPVPRQQRLYCLKDASITAQRLGLPAAGGPYFRMVGHAGSNPLVGQQVEAEPVVLFAKLLAAAERGAKPAATAADLCDVARQGDPAVRTEAAQMLVERPDLRSQLSVVQWSQLVVKASGETEDVAYKIALAELCAEQRVDGLLEGLIIALGQVKDAEYARCVGRIAHQLCGEGATAPLRDRLLTVKDADERGALLLAMGASNTDSALQTLLELRRAAGKDVAIEAALREHRTVKVKPAVLDGGK